MSGPCDDLLTLLIFRRQKEIINIANAAALCVGASSDTWTSLDFNKLQHTVSGVLA
jgi:hypothetical protein